MATHFFCRQRRRRRRRVEEGDHVLRPVHGGRFRVWMRACGERGRGKDRGGQWTGRGRELWQREENRKSENNARRR